MTQALLTEKDFFSDELEEPEGRERALVRPKLKAPLPSAKQLRYYSHTPAYPNEPTRDRFSVIHNDVVGDGVIALVDFNPGDVVFTFSGQILPYQTLFTLQIAPGKYIEDPLVMGKVLHSCDPNMVCSMEHLTFWACRPIKAGEYLSMDYESTEDELFRSFTCCCGSTHCRGEIRGRRYVSESVRQRIKTPRDMPNVITL